MASNDEPTEPRSDQGAGTRLIIWPRWDRLPRWRVWLAFVCLGIVGLILAWLVVGALGLLPSMVDLLGWSGIRIPGGVVVGCLLLASLALGQT